jgi:hypothetical protein
VEWANTVLGDEAPGVGRRRRKAGRHDGLTFGLPVGQFQIQPEEEDEGVFGGAHPIGGANGEVESGVGVAEAVGAGDFEAAIEVAQNSTVGGHDLAAQSAQGNGGFGDGDGDGGRLPAHERERLLLALLKLEAKPFDVKLKGRQWSPPEGRG